MALTRRFGRRRVTLVLLILTSVMLLTLDSRDFGPIDGARSGVLGVFAPVGDFFGTITSPVSNTWNGAFSYDDVEAENKRLKAELDELRGKEIQEDQARIELEQLKTSLDIPFVAELPKENARIISGGITNFDDTVKIDKGSGSGIERGMAVVSGSGLVGQVVETSDGFSMVRVITDRDLRVGVKVRDKRGLAILTGKGDPHRLTGEVDRVSDYAEGDIVVTSGAEGSPYPEGIPVGRIAGITADELASKKDLEVDVLVTLNDLEFVTVVKKAA